MYTYQPSQQLDSTIAHPYEGSQNVSSNEQRFDNLRSSSLPRQQRANETNPAEIYPNIHFEEVQSSESGARRVSPKGLADVRQLDNVPAAGNISPEERSSNAGSKWWDKKPFGSPPPQQQQDTDDGHTDHAELEPEQDTTEPQFHHEPAQQWWKDRPFDPKSPTPNATPTPAPNPTPTQAPLADSNYKNNGIEVRLSGFTPLLGLTYVGAPPAAPPTVMDATPDVWYSEYQAKREIEAAAEEDERIRNLRQKKEETKGGISYKVGKFFSNTSAAVSKGVTGVADSHEVKVREANIKQAKARLAKYWPKHNADNFIVEFDAFGLHKNIPIRGHIILTQTSLLFLGKGKNDLVIVDEILLSDIVSYTKAVALSCVDKEARWVITLPNSFVQADAIQIFTNNGIKLDFINFSQSILKSASAIPGSHISDGHDDVLAYDRFLNYFDHAWRAQAPRR